MKAKAHEQQEDLFGAPAGHGQSVEQSDLFGDSVTFSAGGRKTAYRFDKKRVRSPEHLAALKEKVLRRHAVERTRRILDEMETLIGVRKVIRKGEVVGHQLRKGARLMLGPNPNSQYPKGSLVREAMLNGLLEGARKKLVSLFETRDNEPLVWKTMHALTARLRAARPEEDWASIIQVAVGFWVQEDFMANERSGLTIRNVKSQAQIDANRKRARRGSRQQQVERHRAPSADTATDEEDLDLDITNIYIDARLANAAQDDEVDEMYEESMEEWENRSSDVATRCALRGTSAVDVPTEDEEEVREKLAADDGESIAYVDDDAESLVDANVIHLDFVDDEIDLVEFGQ